jgi:hypothetical protein
MWAHCFTHERARALRLKRWYLGIAFGEQVLTARGLRTAGAMTKAPRRGQNFDADGRGSDVVIVARSENGLVSGWSNRGCNSAAARGASQCSRMAGTPLQDGAPTARCRSDVDKGGGARSEAAEVERWQRHLLYLQHTGHPGWVDATAIPFPIQIDLWYECIETVCLYWVLPP